MTPEDLLAQARLFALPLKREFRGVRIREGIVFRGPSGWGEFAPFVEHSDRHAGRWLSAALEQAFGSWPAPLRTRIPVNAIVPVADVDTTRELVREAVASGCTTIKTKVGTVSFDDDAARVAAIRAELDAQGVTGAIRVDTNQMWTVQHAIERIAVLDELARGLEYVEQPVRDAVEMKELRRHVSVPIAVDEGLRLTSDPETVARTLPEIADVAVIKSIPLGGVHAALRVAERITLPVVVSGSLDTSVGLASGLALAAALPNLEHACGLATGALLAEDITEDGARVVDGAIEVRRWTPDERRLQPLDGQAGIYWAGRLARAWQHVVLPEGIAG